MFTIIYFDLNTTVTYRPTTRKGIGKNILAEAYAHNNRMSIDR
jgi:hypothetical protein